MKKNLDVNEKKDMEPIDTYLHEKKYTEYVESQSESEQDDYASEVSLQGDDSDGYCDDINPYDSWSHE